MKIITHENERWWGKSFTLITSDEKASIDISIIKEIPSVGFISRLLVLDTVRRQGRANALLMFAEDVAKKHGCKRVFLSATKGTFLFPWFERCGYKVYDEYLDYPNGEPVSMSKDL